MSIHFGYDPIDIEKKVLDLYESTRTPVSQYDVVLDIDVGSSDNVIESYGDSDPVTTRRWQTIVGNDDGGFDKYVGYRGTNLISYGGFTGREGLCALPSDADITKKHLLSIHWFMEEGHIRVNGKILDNSEFTTNALATGHPYGTLFGAHPRVSSHTHLESQPVWDRDDNGVHDRR